MLCCQSSQAAMSSLACRLVLQRCPCSRSTFNEPNGVSLQALTLPAAPLATHRTRDAVALEQVPKVVAGVRAAPSELCSDLWKISPACLLGRRLNQALRSASQLGPELLATLGRCGPKILIGLFNQSPRPRLNGPGIHWVEPGEDRNLVGGELDRLAHDHPQHALGAGRLGQ